MNKIIIILWFAFIFLLSLEIKNLSIKKLFKEIGHYLCYRKGILDEFDNLNKTYRKWVVFFINIYKLYKKIQNEFIVYYRRTHPINKVLLSSLVIIGLVLIICIIHPINIYMNNHYYFLLSFKILKWSAGLIINMNAAYIIFNYTEEYKKNREISDKLNGLYHRGIVLIKNTLLDSGKKYIITKSMSWKNENINLIFDLSSNHSFNSNLSWDYSHISNLNNSFTSNTLIIKDGGWNSLLINIESLIEITNELLNINNKYNLNIGDDDYYNLKYYVDDLNQSSKEIFNKFKIMSSNHNNEIFLWCRPDVAAIKNIIYIIEQIENINQKFFKLIYKDY